MNDIQKTKKPLVVRLKAVSEHANARGKEKIAVRYGTILESLLKSQDEITPKKLEGKNLAKALEMAVKKANLAVSRLVAGSSIKSSPTPFELASASPDVIKYLEMLCRKAVVDPNKLTATQLKKALTIAQSGLKERQNAANAGTVDDSCTNKLRGILS